LRSVIINLKRFKIMVRKLLEARLKKFSKNQLLDQINGELTDLEYSVISELLITRGCVKEELPQHTPLAVPSPKKEVTKESIVDQTTTEESLINPTQRRDVLYLDPRILKVEEDFNTRIDYGDIDELKNSIIENGVRIPLRGYKDGDIFVITDGHRRYKAVMKALSEGVDIARIPFISEKKKSLDERIFDIILSNDGKQLTPLELGETYKRLMACGYNFTEIAKKIGKTIKHVSDMVTVAGSSKEIKNLINEKTVSATLVSEVKNAIKNNDEAESIIKNKLREKLAASKKEGDEDQPIKVTKKDLKDVVEKRQDNTKTTHIKSIDDISKKEQKESQPVKLYTKKEVIALLCKQIKVCQEALPREIALKLDNIGLVI